MKLGVAHHQLAALDAARVDVLVDGAAVGVGRPYIWGLSGFGQQGVERVLDILNNELKLAMVGCGARSIKEITAASIIDTGRRG